MTSAQQFCSVLGRVDGKIVNDTLPLARHFWHELGVGGVNYPTLALVARRWLCTAVSTARVEGDFSVKKHLFDATRLQTSSPHVLNELLISWNFGELSTELPRAESDRKARWPTKIMLRPA